MSQQWFMSSEWNTCYATKSHHILNACSLSLSTGACKTSKIAEELGLTAMEDRKWFVQGACAPTGQGIYEAMTEMARLSKDFQNSKR